MYIKRLRNALFDENLSIKSSAKRILDSNVIDKEFTLLVPEKRINKSTMLINLDFFDNCTIDLMRN